MNTTREQLLTATAQLLESQGYYGTGLNEIVRVSGAPKGSVYHYFPAGKQQIAAEALEWYSPRVMAFIDRALASGRTPAARVRALFDAFARRVEEGDFRKSCAVGTVCLDLDVELEGLRGVAAEAFGEWVSRIAAHFPGDPAAARSFASLLLTAIEGAYIRARADRSSGAFKEAGEWLGELAARRFDAPPSRVRSRRRNSR